MGGQHCTKIASPLTSSVPFTLLLHWLSRAASVVPRCCEGLQQMSENSHNTAVGTVTAISASHLGTRHALPGKGIIMPKWAFLMPGSSSTQALPVSLTARTRDRDHTAGSCGLGPMSNQQYMIRHATGKHSQLFQAGGMLHPSHLDF